MPHKGGHHVRQCFTVILYHTHSLASLTLPFPLLAHLPCKMTTVSVSALSLTSNPPSPHSQIPVLTPSFSRAEIDSPRRRQVPSTKAPARLPIEGRDGEGRRSEWEGDTTRQGGVEKRRMAEETVGRRRKAATGARVEKLEGRRRTASMFIFLLFFLYGI